MPANVTSGMLTLRPARADDVPLIGKLIRELADYEREPQAAVATDEDLLRDGFGPSPRFHAVLADWDGAPAGFALYFFNYSTWQGRPGLYLEDLYVRPAYRGRGIGKALLVHLAQIAVENDCGRYQWQVLDWNASALAFYESLGARVLKEWLTLRVEGQALQRLASLKAP